MRFSCHLLIAHKKALQGLFAFGCWSHLFPSFPFFFWGFHEERQRGRCCRLRAKCGAGRVQLATALCWAAGLLQAAWEMCSLLGGRFSQTPLLLSFMAGTRLTLLAVAIPKHCGIKLFSGSVFFFSDADKEQVLSLRIEPDFCWKSVCAAACAVFSVQACRKYSLPLTHTMV